jgi:hypothetical protein
MRGRRGVVETRDVVETSTVPDAKERELKEKEKSLTDARTTPHTIIGNVAYTCAKKKIKPKESP